MEFIKHHRSYQSIVQKAFELDITKRNCWTEAERQILIDYYKTHQKISKKELAKLIPGHNPFQIITQASYLGLAKPKFKWTQDKIEILKANYPSLGAKCSTMLGCSPTACTQMANKLEIKFNKPEVKPKTERVKFAWTAEEDNIIKLFYNTDIEQCVSLLVNRNRNSIIARAKALGIKADRTKKVKCVETGNIYSVKDAAEFISKTSGSIIYAIKNKTLAGGYHWEYIETPEKNS